jgi:hypothetical protein
MSARLRHAIAVLKIVLNHGFGNLPLGHEYQVIEYDYSKPGNTNYTQTAVNGSHETGDMDDVTPLRNYENAA